MKKLFVFNGDYPWQRRLRFSYDPALKNALKVYPGITWRKVGGRDEWSAPVEGLNFISSVAATMNYGVENYSILVPGAKPSTPLNDTLWPFQQDAVKACLNALPQETGYVYNFEMGLGKTPTAIETLRQLDTRKALIVCPAMVRKTWVREFQKWWPNAPQIIEVKNGTKIPPEVGSSEGIVVTSFGLLRQLRAVSDGNPAQGVLQALVIDELHYLQGQSAQRSGAIKKVLQGCVGMPVLGLTGTFFPNNPASAWSPLDTLFPSRYGTFNAFKSRYCNAVANDFGTAYTGANADYAAELSERLKHILFRATKSEPAIRALLPALRVTSVYTKRSERAVAGCSLANDAIAGGALGVVVLTHLRESAEALGVKLQTQHPSATLAIITGAQSPESRDRQIQALREAPGLRILVATMHSVGIGIDLTFADYVLFAELDYSYATMVQALGRFNRLSSQRGTLVHLLLDEEGDAKGEALLQKVQITADILGAGDVDNKLLPVLFQQADAMSPEELRSKLLAAIEESE